MEIFKKYSNQLIWLSILALSIVVIGCGGGGSASGTSSGATTAPTVISTVPDNNITAVPSNRKITATFSTAMD
ncbi:MAG: Ig-like domain-containing protein, partial [Sulfuricurvum sp.]